MANGIISLLHDVQDSPNATQAERVLAAAAIESIQLSRDNQKKLNDLGDQGLFDPKWWRDKVIPGLTIAIIIWGLFTLTPALLAVIQ